MDIDFARKLIIISSVIILGLNLHQLLSSYQYLQKQIEQFRTSYENEESNGLNLINIIFYGLLPVVYLALLFYSGYSALIITVFVLKFIGGGVFSWRIQQRVLDSRPFYMFDYYVSKIDNVVSILLFSFVLTLLYL